MGATGGGARPAHGSPRGAQRAGSAAGSARAGEPQRGTRPGRQPAASPPRLPSAVRGAALPAAAPPLRGGGGPSPPSSGPGPGPRLRLRVTILAPSACMPGPASAPRRRCAPGTTTPSTPRARRAALPGPEVQVALPAGVSGSGCALRSRPGLPGARRLRRGHRAVRRGRGARTSQRLGPGPRPRRPQPRPGVASGVPAPLGGPWARAPRWAAAPERA